MFLLVPFIAAMLSIERASRYACMDRASRAVARASTWSTELRHNVTYMVMVQEDDKQADISSRLLRKQSPSLVECRNAAPHSCQHQRAQSVHSSLCPSYDKQHTAL